MAAKLILPGFGGAFTTVAVGSTDAIIQEAGSDLTLDMSHCTHFAIQVQSTAGTPVGTVQLTQTFSGVSQSNLGTTINVATDVATLFDATDGPFGQIRIDATAITGGSVKFTIVGFNNFVY